MTRAWTPITAIAELPAPPPGVVDLVLFDLDAADPAVASVNDQAERERAGRFVFPRDARRFAVAHGVLRRLLGHRLTCDPTELAFGQGPQGKPALAAPHDRLAFNLSHSAEVGLIALGEVEALGVDIEQARPLDDLAEMAAQTFAPAEAASVLAQPPDRRLEHFFCCWTRKEAVIKLWGEGLSADLKAFAVSTEPDLAHDRLSVIDRAAIDLWSFRPDPAHHAALAAPAGAVEALRLWRLAF